MRLLVFVLMVGNFLIQCKSRESQLAETARSDIFSKLDKALSILKVLNPEAYEAALIYRNISLAAPTQKDLDKPGAAKAHFDKLDDYKKNRFTGANDGLQNHFKAVSALNARYGNQAFLKSIGAFKRILRQVDVGAENIYGEKYLSNTNRPDISYTGPNLFQSARTLEGENIFRAVTIIGSLGHDDIEYKLSSNLYAVGVLGEDVRVNETIHKKFVYAVTRYNRLYPKNEADLGGAYNYQMLAGFYMGCQLTKFGVSTIQLNKNLVVDRILDVALKEYYHNNNPDSCLQDFLANRVCKTESKSQVANLIALATKATNQTYMFNLATDLPALGGYYYKVITLEERLGDQRQKQLFHLGYINPFMWDDDGLTAKENPFKPAKNFPIPPDFPVEEMRRVVPHMDARLAHVGYVMEQHLRGAEFGVRVCSEYKETLMQAFEANALERKLMTMGYLYPGFTVAQVKKRATFSKYFPPPVSDDDLATAVDSLNVKYSEHPGLLDFEYPEILDRPIAQSN